MDLAGEEEVEIADQPLPDGDGVPPADDALQSTQLDPNSAVVMSVVAQNKSRKSRQAWVVPDNPVILDDDAGTSGNFMLSDTEFATMTARARRFALESSETCRRSTHVRRIRW